jgi:hypothetical protein
MSERRTANVPLTLAQLGQMLGLHETQRVFNVYFRPDTATVVVQIEGGEELPSWDDGFGGPPPDWRMHGLESPWVRPGEIPVPADQ